jgi:outer membrane protein TolC
MRVVAALTLAILATGCTREFYHRRADRDTYSAIWERNKDPRWAVPTVRIDPPPQSRLYDPFNPDHPPMPPDDPAADRFMRWADGKRGFLRWHQDGDAPWVEDPDWINTLPLDDKGILQLTTEKAVELGVLNSRAYQTQLEQLYLASLSLTLNRFDFAVHWLGTNNTTATHFGSNADETNSLSVVNNLGLAQAFTAGGQLTMDFANTFVFQFTGNTPSFATGNILINFVQPLLRNFGRDYRMEALTEGERNLLYQLRTFAEYRKQFTFNVATQTYLFLLLQEQRIRNDRATLKSKQQNLRLHEALFHSGLIASVTVDQALASLQSAQATLIQDEASFDTSLDLYKDTLGLPPRINIHLDDSVLSAFQLSDPSLDTLQGTLETFLSEYRQMDVAPSLAKLQDGFRHLKSFDAEMVRLVDMARQELGRWKATPVGETQDPAVANRIRDTQEARTRDLEDIAGDLAKIRSDIERDSAALTEPTRTKGWEALQQDARQENALAAQLYVLQNQVRVYLIKLKPVPYDLPAAIDFALENRLDLMNQKAQVVDAWRQIRVTANQLQTELDVNVGVNIANKPGSMNPFDFRASNSSESVGVFLDTPLNRYAQQVAYRTAMINYQQARRSYMNLGDQIQRTIRQDLRSLNTTRLNFEIARQNLITTARQVESVREELLLERQPRPTATLDLLNALDGVLTAKNTLIANWVAYEVGRYQLLLDLDALQVDERGLYVDADYGQPDQASGTHSDTPQQFSSGTVPPSATAN